MAEIAADRFIDPEMINGYHAHIYYDPAQTRDAASRLREGLGAAFPAATLGSWHDEAVGPHTVAMYQIALRSRILPGSCRG
jgi:aromatic ring-cleaving dioxygenase